jgi:dienelactone hydrolase
MFDLRNHGESGGGLSGVGQEEWRDVLGAIAYLARRPDTASSPVALLGLCMGANASLAAIARGGAAASRVRCLVAVQPVSALVFVRSYVRDVYSRLGLVLIPLVDRLVRLRGGHPLAEMSPVADAARVRVPCLFLQAVRDPWTEPEDVRAIAGAVAGPSELVMLDEPRRRFDTYDLVGERPEGMLSFLAEHL